LVQPENGSLEAIATPNVLPSLSNLEQQFGAASVHLALA
jgi:hypothetical protein